MTAAALGAGGLAGCSSITGLLGGPKYQDVTVAQLVPPVSIFSDGWSRNDNLNDNFEAGFVNEDESIFVLISISIFEEVSAAEETFTSVREGFRDPVEMSFADEAFWDTQNEQYAYTVFRDSNALCQTVSARQVGINIAPDQQRAQSAARSTYQHWQDL